MIEDLIPLGYLAASALFILALKWLSHPSTARRGVKAGEIGLFRRLARESSRPVTISMLQSHVRPDNWRTLLADILLAVTDPRVTSGERA